jgi:hypothetical protein
VAGQESDPARHMLSHSRTGGDGGGGRGSSRDEGGTEYDILPGAGDRAKQEGKDGRDTGDSMTGEEEEGKWRP